MATPAPATVIAVSNIFGSKSTYFNTFLASMLHGVIGSFTVIYTNDETFGIIYSRFCFVQTAYIYG